MSTPPTATSAPAKIETKELSKQAQGNLYTIIQQQLDKASRAINLSKEIALILSQPKNELIVNFPVRMDDGTYRLYKGYRVQHNNILGPFKGGIRYHEDVTLDELAGAHHPPLHARARPEHRPRVRHPCARRRHQRADNGLDHGHVHERDR